VTALAEIALLHAFLATVVLTGLHHPVAAAVRAPAVLSSHRSAFWHMPHNIIGIYLFVKSVILPNSNVVIYLLQAIISGLLFAFQRGITML
jgi:hypothetical protein